MKKNLLLLVMVLLVGSIKAQTFTVGGISYTVIAPGEVQINSYQCYSGSLAIPSTVNNMAIDYAVTKLNDYAFYNCATLTSVTIPTSVTLLGTGTFRQCTALTTAIVPNSLTTIAPQTFLTCTNLTSVTIPNTVTSLQTYSFSGCTSLTSLTIPNSVTALADYAFFQCTNLPSITLPNALTTIGYATFSQCTTLSSITFPASVASLGTYAFRSCTGLTSVTALSLTPIVLNPLAFNLVNVSVIPLYVPSGSVAAYDAAPVWQNFNPVTAIVVPLTVYYQDLDDDGYGNTAVFLEAETPPLGYVALDGDCNDNDPAINPGATEICYNNIDDNCDSVKSEACSPVLVSVNNPGTMSNFSIALSANPYNFAGAITRDYKYEVKNMANNEVREFIRTGPFARFFTIPADIRGFGIQYEIRAAAVINGEQLNYFVAPITVNSPSVPTIKLSSFSCNTTLTRPGGTISANPAANVVLYRFQLRLTSDDGDMPTYYYAESPSRFINLNYFSGLTVTEGTSYSIAVQYITNNSGTELTAPYGEECTVATPVVAPLTKEISTLARVVETPLTAIGYPNPFADSFKLEVKTSSSSMVNITVYDMLGRLIDTRSSKATELENTNIGSNYPTGVYNIIVTQDDETRTVRMVKR